MSVIVAGASGAIGRRLISELVDQGHAVTDEEGLGDATDKSINDVSLSLLRADNRVISTLSREDLEFLLW